MIILKPYLQTFVWIRLWCRQISLGICQELAMDRLRFQHALLDEQDTETMVSQCRVFLWDFWLPLWTALCCKYHFHYTPAESKENMVSVSIARHAWIIAPLVRFIVQGNIFPKPKINVLSRWPCKWMYAFLCVFGNFSILNLSFTNQHPL